ncbi:hypothetical protein GCM10008904_15880 [Paraclostridium ghonii]|uniref:Membrane protein n=1 Tax=Paraclostridium ghonii TaxID=29358 RepID=A0ABU0MZF5_9FIRM|nr:DUF975 family protein [Paeniclostridium ghonii]MDQ0556292.1 putative membrane protein [Paeniclostridium ghonii]
MSKSELRVGMKEEARRQLADNKTDMMIATVLVGIIAFIPEFLNEEIFTSYRIILLISIISTIISAPLVIGLNMISLDCVRGEKIKVKDILKGFNRLYQSYGYVLIQMSITFILTGPLVAIPLFLVKDTHTKITMITLISSLSNMFFSIVFSQLQYVVADKKDISLIEATKKSIFIIKNYIWDYILLSLSFIGWMVLVAFTFGIAYIWVGPYIQLTFTNFYEYIKKDELDSYKKSKNNSLKVGLLVGALLCSYTLIEDNITQKILTPPVIKKVLEENNLKLISFNEETSYYISKEESIEYRIEPKYTNLSDLSKYTVVVKNHPLDSKKGDRVNSTVIYIISDGDKLLGVSCEPNDSKKKIEHYNSIPGKYDIKGNKL